MQLEETLDYMAVPASDTQGQHHTRQGVTPGIETKMKETAAHHKRTDQILDCYNPATSSPSFSPCCSMGSHLYAQIPHLEEVGVFCAVCKEVFFALHIIQTAVAI